MTKSQQGLKPCALGFAFGLWWAIGMLVVAWVGMTSAYGHGFVHVMSTVYVGFAPTFLGGIVGFIWGFIDFFIFGWLIAWTYNCCSQCGRCCVKAKD